jgi:hypothetical protein
VTTDPLKALPLQWRLTEVPEDDILNLIGAVHSVEETLNSGAERRLQRAVGNVYEDVRAHLPNERLRLAANRYIDVEGGWRIAWGDYRFALGMWLGSRMQLRLDAEAVVGDEPAELLEEIAPAHASQIGTSIAWAAEIFNDQVPSLIEELAPRPAPTP